MENLIASDSMAFWILAAVVARGAHAARACLREVGRIISIAAVLSWTNGCLVTRPTGPATERRCEDDPPEAPAAPCPQVLGAATDPNGAIAPVQIVFRNELSDAFRLSGLLVVMDHTVQYKAEDEMGCIERGMELPIFSGSMTPGEHILQVVIRFRGTSDFHCYKFEATSAHSFVTSEGKRFRVAIVPFEKGDRPLQERPAVRYVETEPPVEVPPGVGP
jgi:hypothetical protein